MKTSNQLNQNDTESTLFNSLPSEVIEELETVIGDIGGFLQNFCNRFEELSTESFATKVNPNNNDDSAEAREDWEAQRLVAEQGLREKIELLTGAWLRLEEEQRTLLQMKNGLAVELSTRAGENTAGSVGSNMKCLPGSSRHSTKTVQSAVCEFERLRQEIQSSRPKQSPK
jgi:hypothetical protein